MARERVSRRRIGAAVIAVVLALAGIVHADCVRSCGAELADCKRTRCAGQRGADRRRCLADCRGGIGCGGGMGTLAYVVSTCRVQGEGQLGTQELRIRRNGCDPVTVVRFANDEPVADPIGLCTIVSKNHSGHLSPVAGVFQRLAVSGDGSSVVFEVSNQFQLIGRTEVAPEQQGFFHVRADGTGLRRLAPPSRDPVYRIIPNTPGTVDPTGLGVFPTLAPKLAVSDDGSRIVYSDRGPAASGREAPQMVALDVATEERRQLTHFEPEVEPPDSPHPLLWPTFFTRDLIGFEHPRPDRWESWLVDFDGSNLRDISGPDASVPGPDGDVVRKLGISTRRFSLFTRVVPGATENADIFPGFPAIEIFRRAGEDLIQLTRFRRIDIGIMAARRGEVTFFASGDPLGTNPSEHCQVFRMSLLGTNLRQLTRLGTGQPSREGCGFFGETPGCTFVPVQWDWAAVRSRSVSFYSDCDPFGRNPNGIQIFTIDRDGSRLRQVTHTAGGRTGADGVLEVEIPGPMAVGGR